LWAGFVLPIDLEALPVIFRLPSASVFVDHGAGKECPAENCVLQLAEQQLVGFRAVYVFDISQTEGEELPTLTEVQGDVSGHRERLFEFVESQGVELNYSERIAPAKGLSHGGKITLLSGMHPAEEFSTLVHEIAHEMLHRGNRRTLTTKLVRETEAEAVAFVVCQSVGLQNGTASQDYVTVKFM
jgi:hypothetical protein